ncbi:MAG: DUF934 domain-containing protein [Pseudomonadota bacterium]
MLLLDVTGALDDLWPAVALEAPLPVSGRVLVGLDRLDEAAASPLEIGVAIANDTALDRLEPHLGRLALIAVAFPAFSDGRGFSLGRRLRAMGFAGRLRASGPVIADQFGYLLQCGFDEVALPEAVAKRQPIEQWLDRAQAVTVGYQRNYAGRASILDRRRAAGLGGEASAR